MLDFECKNFTIQRISIYIFQSGNTKLAVEISKKRERGERKKEKGRKEHYERDETGRIQVQ